MERGASAFSPAVRARVVQQLQDLMDRPNVAPRTAIAAARALGQFARLALDEMKLAAQLPQPEPERADTQDYAAVLREQAQKERLLSEWTSQYTTTKSAKSPSGLQ